MTLDRLSYSVNLNIMAIRYFLHSFWICKSYLIILGAVYEYLVSMRDLKDRINDCQDSPLTNARPDLLPHGLTGHALLYLGDDAGSQALGHRDTPLKLYKYLYIFWTIFKQNTFMRRTLIKNASQH